MQHLQSYLIIVSKVVVVIRNDVFIADTQAGGVEIKLRFFLCRDTDTYVEFVVKFI